MINKSIKYLFNKSLIKFLWIAIIIFLSLFLTFLFFQFTIDDAYITFRHSLNLINEGTLSWNLTGVREEAFTNPLFVILGSIGIKLQLKPELPIKIISLFIFFFWVRRLIQISKKEKYINKYIISSIFLIFIPTYIHAYAGLETLLFSYLFFEFLNSDGIGYPKDLSIALLMMLCRPEGGLFILLGIIARILRTFKNDLKDISIKSSKFWNHFFTFILIFTSIIMSYKFIYFGDFLPNTFYSKSQDGVSLYVNLSNLISSLPWLILFLVTFPPKFLRTQEIIKYIGIIIIYVIYLKSNLAMNYSDRFWFQLFWPAILYGICKKKNILDFEEIKLDFSSFLKFFFKKIFSASFLGISYLFLKCMGIFDPLSIIGTIDKTGRYIRGWATLGESLNLVLPKESKIYVGEAGFIPYYAKRKTYDLHGLGTKEIARNGLTQKYLETEDIDVFILYASGCRESQTYKKRLSQEMGFIKRNNFEYVGSVPYAPTLCLNLYSKSAYKKYFLQENYKNNFNATYLNKLTLKDTVFKNFTYSYNYLFSKEGIIPKE